MRRQHNTQPPRGAGPRRLCQEGSDAANHVHLSYKNSIAGVPHRVCDPPHILSVHYVT
jgi:hypothetical protein